MIVSDVVVHHKHLGYEPPVLQEILGPNRSEGTSARMAGNATEEWHASDIMFKRVRGAWSGADKARPHMINVESFVSEPTASDRSQEAHCDVAAVTSMLERRSNIVPSIFVAAPLGKACGKAPEYKGMPLRRVQKQAENRVGIRERKPPESMNILACANGSSNIVMVSDTTKGGEISNYRLRVPVREGEIVPSKWTNQ